MFPKIKHLLPYYCNMVVTWFSKIRRKLPLRPLHYCEDSGNHVHMASILPSITSRDIPPAPRRHTIRVTMCKKSETQLGTFCGSMVTYSGCAGTDKISILLIWLPLEDIKSAVPACYPSALLSLAKTQADKTLTTVKI